MSQDFDLIIIGAGVGGHGAALHAIECGLKWPSSKVARWSASWDPERKSSKFELG